MTASRSSTAGLCIVWAPNSRYVCISEKYECKHARALSVESTDQPFGPLAPRFRL